MIIDSHCHAWDYWPYQDKNNHEPNQIPVPYPHNWGNIDQLVYEMKKNNVDYATIVSAQIWKNPENNIYIKNSLKKYKNLFQFFDFDSYWSDSYQSRNADKRLSKICHNNKLIGITQYLGGDDAKWLYSKEGEKLFDLIANEKLIVSFSCSPKHQKSIRIVAENYPEIPILLHHMGGMKISLEKEEIDEVLKSSIHKNIYLKFSGYNYVLGEERRWDFPYHDALWIYKDAYKSFGSNMVWGSDFPVVKYSSTYKQTLEVINKYCNFISENDKNLILGKNLEKLLIDRGKID